MSQPQHSQHSSHIAAPDDACGHTCPLAAAVGPDRMAVDLVGDGPDLVGRRTFLSKATLALAAAALAACGGGDITSPGTDSSTGSTGSSSVTGGTVLTLSAYPALAAVNGVALVTIRGIPMAIVRTGDASFVALSRRCPHQGGTVNATGTGFLCPIHGARFSLAGAWLGGQRTSSLTAYATQYDAAAGTLTVG